MADKVGIINKYMSLTKQLGKAAVSAFYPNDVEYYLCAFELVGSSGVEGYFVFPIQPSSISKTEPSRTNIKKSLSGITVLKNSSFVPQELSIKGNFGRRFKILSNLNGTAFASVNIAKKSGLTFDTPTLSQSIKTGYGAIKVLQKIIEESNKVDNNGMPKQLYFYNMGLGESYLVTIPPSGVNFTQTEDRNMIWQYSINMTILAPLKDVATPYENVSQANRNIMAKGAISKLINVVALDVKRLLV